MATTSSLFPSQPLSGSGVASASEWLATLLEEVTGYYRPHLESYRQEESTILTKLNKPLTGVHMARSEKQQVYLQTVSRKNVQQAKAEYQVREETRERDLKALEALQANRPAKPPGRR